MTLLQLIQLWITGAMIGLAVANGGAGRWKPAFIYAVIAVVCIIYDITKYLP